MATKKPLVYGSDGRPQQLQSGDTVLTTDSSLTGSGTPTSSLKIAKSLIWFGL